MARNYGRDDSRKPSSEYLLLDHLQRLGRNRGDYKAVQIHLSRLRPHARQPHHVRVAAATFDTQLGVCVCACARVWCVCVCETPEADVQALCTAKCVRVCVCARVRACVCESSYG